jgi:hypothetical protein
VGPILACGLIGYTGDVRRFTTRDKFASYAGVAPIELSSGGRIVHRLSRRGNRQLNHAIHMVAICQIRQTNSDRMAELVSLIADTADQNPSIPTSRAALAAANLDAGDEAAAQEPVDEAAADSFSLPRSHRWRRTWAVSPLCLATARRPSRTSSRQPSPMPVAKCWSVTNFLRSSVWT